MMMSVKMMIVKSTQNQGYSSQIHTHTHTHQTTSQPTAAVYKFQIKHFRISNNCSVWAILYRPPYNFPLAIRHVCFSVYFIILTV